MAKSGKVQFEDFSIRCKGAINSATERALEEAAGEIEAEAKRGTRVDTGQTKNAWAHRVDGGTATIGNPLENAIWEEFGTGEYATKGGRKGGWVYQSEKDGKWYRTKGKKPTHALQNAFTKLRGKVKKYIEQQFGRL